MIPFIYAADSHGDLIDRSARDALLEFKEKFKPEIVICGGDAFDLRSLRQGASDEDRAEGVTDDIEAGLDFINAYKPTVFLWGNHDDRLVQVARSCRNGNLREYCRLMHDKILDTLMAIGCKSVPYDVEDGVYEIADYKIVHGYNAGVHAAYTSAGIYGNSIMGHVHRFGEARVKRHPAVTGYSCGCMMDIKKAHYARRNPATLTWQNGWMYGWIVDGRLVVQSAKRADSGKFIIPLDFKEAG